MNTITAGKINTATKNLKSVIKQAKRRLFEFETMANLYELERGNFKKYNSATSLIRDAKKSK
ncbi:hypothetical protein A2733_01085 [Candidatus Nomurabacteria bacterium RIFCSPHIGHO2_01_FULL_40_20]|uniref:Uncharacterized protein n=1 Tax=Candidatus Nomurabacteria bacterium RIFCSPHIGHO2_01_FULL_40_20 TaxID=1801738 RepID=A0A1F6V2V6_9BACT|nr:MAG: hypothetical protein A2733_01085 [Candidatus Nomurabacteria bacterium RIFCSPHIGHO2_01_FULL_40_20]